MATHDVLPGHRPCPRCEGSGGEPYVIRTTRSRRRAGEVDVQMGERVCARCGGTGEVLDAASEVVDVDLALRLADVVRNAVTRPYVIGSWVRGVEDVGRAAGKRLQAYELRRAARAAGLQVAS